MDEKEKKVEEKTTESPASEGEKKSDAPADTIDYKAELEKAKGQLKQAEHTIIKLKTDKKNGKGQEPGEEGGEEAGEEGKEVIVDIGKVKAELQAEQKQELEKFKLDIVKGTVEEALSSMTDNPDELALIKFNYENRISKTGFDKESIKRDLADAQLLANRPRLEKTMKEMREKIISDKTKSGGAATGHDVTPAPTGLTDAEEAFCHQQSKARGVSVEVVRAKLIENKKK